MPWGFLIVAVVGAAFTFNAHVSLRRLGPLNMPNFLAGWLTSELAVHHLAWQAVATVVFVAAGALDAWPGWVGLGLTLVSWAGLWALVPIARRAAPAVEGALQDALGESYRQDLPAAVAERVERDPAPGIPVNPFRFKDSRVRVEKDIPYVPNGGQRHRLDVYCPVSGAARAPVLLQVHGGGWVIGNKHEQAKPLMVHLAARGWICVAANYRLSPKATFPDHLVDLKRAIAWIRGNIARYGGDPDFLAATGGSAGGHLSALLGLTGNDPDYQPGFEDVDTSLRACVPFYGIYDFSGEYGLQAQKGIVSFIEKTVMKKKIADDLDAFRRASPIHRLRADAPPFFVIHGANDSLASVEEGRHFAKLLGEASDAPVAYAEIPGAQHAFDVFHSIRTGHVVQAVDRFLSWTHAAYVREGIAGGAARTG